MLAPDCFENDPVKMPEAQNIPFPSFSWLIDDLKKADFGQIEEAIEEMGKFDVVVQSKLKEVFLDHILPLKEAA